MKKKRPLEADLDPVNTPHGRPGRQTAKQARRLAQPQADTGAGKPARGRPGSYAAERAHARIRRARSAG
jgi:hypothetical protein